jgi:hypothetical protein
MIYILCNGFNRAKSPDTRRTHKREDQQLTDTIEEAKDGDILMIDDPIREATARGLITASGKKIEVWSVKFVE